jgi:hypothetical protein
MATGGQKLFLHNQPTVATFTRIAMGRHMHHAESLGSVKGGSRGCDTPQTQPRQAAAGTAIRQD